MAINFWVSQKDSATNGGSPILILGESSMAVGDWVIVTYSIPNSTGMSSTSVTTSTGGVLTQLAVRNSTTAVICRTGVYSWIVDTLSIDITCSGTGASSDGISAACMVFRDDAVNISLDTTATSTQGSGTTPDSPSITVIASNDVVLSCVGSNVDDTSVTAPTSFINQIDSEANDSRDTTSAMAMITLASTAVFDPGSWTNFTSGGWVAHTVALRPGSTITFVGLREYMFPEFPTGLRPARMIGY